MDWCLIASLATQLGGVWSFLKAAFGLGLVIFVHELGHFLVAKACGVKCEKFYVGFDVPIALGPLQLPSALFRKKWGETEYGIGIIPLGGYVKMLGQDDNPANAAKEAERIKVLKEEGTECAATYDPRSYPAKSVPQRMAIISAGVIMNILFAIIFASLAYRMGVKYPPCAISLTVPGSPAWQANLQPGDKILQLGKDQPLDEQLSFTRDLRAAVTKTLANKPLDIHVRHVDGTTEWITLRPENVADGQSRIPMIGASPSWTDRLLVPTLDRWSAISQAGLETGDRVVAVSAGGESVPVTSPYELFTFVVRHPAEELTLEVHRAASGSDRNESAEAKSFELQVPPQPLRGIGVRMRMGAVVAVRRDSPADVAGFRPGDVIRSLDGSPLDDPQSLDARLFAKIGQPVVVQVERPSGGPHPRTLDVTVTPQPPQITRGPIIPGQPSSAETIGLAYSIADTIEGIASESPAAEAGLQAGDVIRAIDFMPAREDAAARQEFHSLGLRTLKLEAGKDEWPFVQALFQTLPPGLRLKLSVTRGDKDMSVELPLAELPGQFEPTRGLAFEPASEVRQAQSWGEAWDLGWRETVFGVDQVIFMLKNIGSLFRHIGGPLLIASVGTQEASQGLSRLLIFLTMLSANLAVLNILPIPVLDGGHMMFLLYEGIVGKPVNERIAVGLTMVGLCFILSLMIYVFGMDIYRLVAY